LARFDSGLSLNLIRKGNYEDRTPYNLYIVWIVDVVVYWKCVVLCCREVMLGYSGQWWDNDPVQTSKIVRKCLSIRDIRCSGADEFHPSYCLLAMPGGLSRCPHDNAHSRGLDYATFITHLNGVYYAAPLPLLATHGPNPAGRRKTGCPIVYMYHK